jgi:hypothetical protein
LCGDPKIATTAMIDGARGIFAQDYELDSDYGLFFNKVTK